jgi:hypothetical protein
MAFMVSSLALSTLTCAREDRSAARAADSAESCHPRLLAEDIGDSTDHSTTPADTAQSTDGT